MNDIINYIIRFLSYDNEKVASLIGYTADKDDWKNYKVVVIPNGMLGHRIELPKEDAFAPRYTVEKGNIIFQTDIIYNAFFFLSSAEETIQPKRDTHQRFVAKYSILGTDERLQTPIVDVYANLIYQLLEEPFPKPKLQKIWLTHDVDTLTFYHSLRGFLGGISRGQWSEAISSVLDFHNDPAFSFDWIAQEDSKIAAQTVYFIKKTKGEGYDYPQYGYNGKIYQYLLKLWKKNNAILGWHSSYYLQSKFPKKLTLPFVEDNVLYHRSHFLRCNISVLQYLANAGNEQNVQIHDFSIGFADKAGFRLQTTRPVRWINPNNYQLTNLMLHPLHMMDVTLSEPHYMNLKYPQALALAKQIIETVEKYNGELCLLFHNSSFVPSTYHTILYSMLIHFLQNK